jgi:predicted house-cleaning NTP pyrophosphatase (Maf/HAM1 superfamily)
MRRIILASESVLKTFVFEKAKLPYTTVPADIDETVYDNLPVEERVVRLAEDKARKVAAENPDATIISADVLTGDDQGNVFTKLTPDQDSFEAAMSLSGKKISIYTGCTVYEKSLGCVSKYIESSITYRSFNEATLRRLIEGDNAAIRSGALGIFFDAPGFTLIERIEGSYTGSFGMPMEFVYEQLDKIQTK